MIISLIAAIGTDRGIGVDNALPWNLPDDLKHFRKLTKGHAVIMGRKTFESIGKILPDRKNIIITRDAAYAVQGGTIAHTLDEALQKAGDDNEIFIIGGAQIFALALPQATKLYLTHVETEPESDVFFPAIDQSIWRETQSEFHPKDEAHEYAFTFKTYERIKS